METKEIAIPALAARLYERTWVRYNQMTSSVPTLTMQSFCKDSRVNYRGMRKWMAQQGHVKPEPDTLQMPPDGNPTFIQLNPVPLPKAIARDVLRQVSITFQEGTVLTLQECSPEGIVSLLETYARRRSALEGTCSR